MCVCEPVQCHVWAGLAPAPGGVCRAGRRRVQGVSRQQLRAEQQTRDELVLLSEAVLQVVHHVLVPGGSLARSDVTKGALNFPASMTTLAAFPQQFFAK